MADPKIKIERYADKENLKKLMKYSKDTFATQSEVNEKFYTKEQIDIKLESVSSEIDTKLNSKANTSDLSDYYTKSEVDNLLSNISGGTGGISEGGNDTQGGLSFWNAVERAPGYDGTSQMNIAEDSNTVEDE